MGFSWGRTLNSQISLVIQLVIKQILIIQISLVLQAGYGATSKFNVYWSECFGFNATGASNSNFFGQSAGIGATNASYSNLMGQQAGKEQQMLLSQISLVRMLVMRAINGNVSSLVRGWLWRNKCFCLKLFLGFAGYQATNANNSNFFGQGAGAGATVC
jgi:hypothetical protein